MSLSLEVFMRSARMVVRDTLSNSEIRFSVQKSGDISEILVHLAGHHILKRVRDVCVEFAAQRRIPRIVASGPWQHRGERGKEVAKRPGDDYIVVEIDVKCDQDDRVSDT